MKTRLLIAVTLLAGCSKNYNLHRAVPCDPGACFDASTQMASHVKLHIDYATGAPLDVEADVQIPLAQAGSSVVFWGGPAVATESGLELDMDGGSVNQFFAGLYSFEDTGYVDMSGGIMQITFKFYNSTTLAEMKDEGYISTYTIGPLTPVANPWDNSNQPVIAGHLPDAIFMVNPALFLTPFDPTYGYILRHLNP